MPKSVARSAPEMRRGAGGAESYDPSGSGPLHLRRKAAVAVTAEGDRVPAGTVRVDARQLEEALSSWAKTAPEPTGPKNKPLVLRTSLRGLDVYAA